MGRKFKKAAAALLAAAMFLQQCNVVSIAESDPTEMSSEAEAAAAEAQAAAEAAAQSEAEAQAAAEAAAQSEAEAAAAEAAAQSEAEAAAQAAAEAAAQSEAEAAAEAAAQSEAEAAAQAAAEAAAQSEAEAAAQAAAEAAAQSEAEAAAQAAAEAAAQSEAEAAAQSEAEAAAQSEAEAAAQSEAEAQAAEAEAEETETAEAETEQPARSSRVNAGAQIGKDDLTAMLENVLPYLFVAETVNFPEMQAEDAEEAEEENLPVPESWILEGDPAGTELASQTWNALTLADAQSTEEVTVINLYFDEFGTLDTTQLYNIFEDQILDVTDDQYYVVNVIADSPEQALDFTGLDISENGLNLYYTESTQPCSVLYNFAAMDGEAFTDYRGTLNLWGTLQGAVLAPAANVVVEQNLSGAVYAQNITVASLEAQLQRNIYIEGGPEATETEEPIPETEAATEAPAPETEAETEAPETEPETEAVTEAPETEPETEILTEKAETETETEAPETELASVPATLQISPKDDDTQDSDAGVDITTYEANAVYTLEVKAEAVYEGEVLTAVKDQEYQIGLFDEEDASVAIDVQTLTIDGGKSEGEITFKDLASGDYYIYVADKNGKRADPEDFEIKGGQPIEINAGDDEDPSLEIQLVFTKLPAKEEYQSPYEGDYTLNITAQAVYEGEVLTAVEKQEYQIGLFVNKTAEAAIKVQTLTIKKGESESQITFEDLASGEYYIYEVYDDGYRIDSKDEHFDIEGKQPIKIEETNAVIVDGVKIVKESLQLEFKDYPDGEFSYDVTVSVKLDVLGHDGEALKTDETFYAMIYKDKNLEDPAIDNPIEFVMNGESSQEEPVTIKPTKDEEQTFYIAETNKKGTINVEDMDASSFVYTPAYESTGNSNKGKFAVEFGKKPKSPAETITNELNDSVVKLKITNTEGDKLSKASFVILDSSGNIVKIDGEKIFTGSLNLTNVLIDGETYYLYEVNAPNDYEENAPYGYTPEPRKEFTVGRGLTTEVTLKNKATVITDYSVSVTKSVYVDEYKVYATSSHPYYLALFSDKEHKEKVSNVETVTISNSFTGMTTFENVDPNGKYYLAETDVYGIALPSNGDPSISYSTSNGEVTGNSMTVQNTYSYLPEGYSYKSMLTLTKKVENASGSAIDVTDTFYIGLFENADYSDKNPQAYSVKCNNSTRLLFDVTNGDKKYYLAELKKSEEDNKYYVITNESDYSYTPSFSVNGVSTDSVTLTKGNDVTVTITNTEKVITEESGPSESVELYLTKRVYYGEDHYEVNDTFYVGLFKDKEMQERWVDEPIKMEMAGQENGVLDLMITMKVSATEDTAIYVAEVHEDGTPVTESEYQSFGYEIGSEQPIPVTFGPTRATAQRAVILNGVYGTMTDSDWNDIYNDIDDLYGDDDEIELADYLEEETVQTGDDTPVAGTLALMASALIVLGYSIRRRRRAS